MNDKERAEMFLRAILIRSQEVQSNINRKEFVLTQETLQEIQSVKCILESIEFRTRFNPGEVVS